MEVIPKTANTLKILEPIRLPIDKFDSIRKAATNEVESSGMEMPCFWF